MPGRAAMLLDDLRIIKLSERESGRLTEVPQDLYGKIQEYILQLQERVLACHDPFSDQAQTLIDEVMAIREKKHDIFKFRVEKVVSLALTHIQDEITNKDEMKKMLPEEREMYDGIIRELEKGKTALFGEAARGIPPGVVPAEGEGLAAACTPEAAGPPEEAMVLVRILTDMEPFMGVDGRVYRLKAEDIVALPGKNAGVLIDRNIALDVMKESEG